MSEDARMTLVPQRVLFLHGGPGLNAELERRFLGDVPSVHWWDQPLVDEHYPAPWQWLVDAAIREAERLASEAGRPIALLASSFGAHLARAVLEYMPHRISHITFAGGILDVRTALTRLGARIAEVNDDPELAAAVRRAASNVDTAFLWALIGRLFSVANLFDFYWSPAAFMQREAMKDMAARGALLHAPTFELALKAFLAQPDYFVRSNWMGSVRVLSGRHDSYAGPEDEQDWRRIFPAAQFELVEAGHFPHLELPPSIWMPPG